MCKLQIEGDCERPQSQKKGDFMTEEKKEVKVENLTVEELTARMFGYKKYWGNKDEN